MSESKKDNEHQQDFIEEHDELADSLDMNFSHDDVHEDEVLDADVVEHDEFSDDLAEFSDDEWAEDFGDEEFGDDQNAQTSYDSQMNASPMRSEKNWFNIAVFGVLGLVVCFILYTYIPRFFGGSDDTGGAQMQQPIAYTDQAAPQPTIDDISTQPASQAENADLAQQALSADLVQIQEAGGLLANPELLGDGVQSIDREDPDAAGNQIFEVLNNAPAMTDADVDNIFDVIDNENTMTEAPSTTQLSETQTNQQPNAPQMLPDAADATPEMPVVANPEVVFENLPEDEAVDTGVTSLAEQNTTPAVEVTEPVVETPVVTTANADVEAMNARMDALMQKLDALASQVEGLASQPATTQPTNTPSADVVALEKTIQDLERKVTDLSKAKDTPVKAVEKPAPTKQATPKAVATKAPVKASPKWDLRGASPGQAYVAEKGTQNIRTLSVGDSLSGVGRITSIAIENGQWVVRGTSGTIQR